MHPAPFLSLRLLPLGASGATPFSDTAPHRTLTTSQPSTPLAPSCATLYTPPCAPQTHPSATPLRTLLHAVCTAGAASTTVGCTHADPEITIIKRGEIPITRYPEDNPQIWGTNSAVDFLDDAAWFAVAVALNTQEQYGSWIWRQPCGGQRE